MGINLLMNLEGCQVSVADSGRNGVLIWHWYRRSAGDGSLASMGVAWSAKRASCGSAPLYLTHWSACFTDFMHASANPFDCG